MKQISGFLLLAAALTLGAADIFKESSEAMTLRLGMRSAKVDAVFNKGEYPLSGSGLRDLKTKNFSLLPAQWGVSYDSSYIYIAISSLLDPRLPAKYTNRDGNIWEDESVEIHLQAQDADKNSFHFIFNAIGGVYDSKNRKAAWNLEGLKLKHKIRKGVWTLEAAIPFAGLGLPSPAAGSVWKINICRSYKSWEAATALAPCFLQYAEPGCFPELVFGGADAPDLVLPDFRLLTRGSSQLTAELRSKTAGEACFDVRVMSPEKASYSGNGENKLLARYTKKASAGKNKQLKLTLPEKKLPANGTLRFTITAPGGKIAARGNMGYKPLVPLNVSNLYMDFATMELVSVCRAECDMAGGKLTLDFRRLEKDYRTPQKKSVLQKKFDIKTSEMKFELRTKIDDLPPGHYKIDYTVFDKSGSKAGTFYEWLFKPGKENPFNAEELKKLTRTFIPRPWTAPAAADNSFTCLHRTYTLGKNALLDSAVSRGKELFRRPAELLLNGRKLALKGKMLKKDKIGADYLLETQADGIRFKVKVRAEYDGLLQYEMEMIPLKKNTHLSTLALKLPLISFPEHGFFDSQETFKAKTPLPLAAGKAQYVDISRVSSCWIGDMDRGMIFGTPTLQGWHVKNLEKAVRITSPEKGSDVDISLWDTRGILEKPRKMRFFLMATPVRTRHPGSRKIRPWVNTITWTGYWVQMYEYHRSGWINPKKLKDFKLYRKFSSCFHYTTSYGVSPFCGEWRYYQQLWNIGTLGRYVIDARTPTRESQEQYAFTEGCLNNRDFSAFKLTMLQEMLKRPELSIRHIYLDLSSPLICRNKQHGCAFVDDFGRLCGSSQVLGSREHVRAIAAMLQQKNPDGMLLMHVFTRTPADAYVDAVIMGELFDQIIARHGNYYKLFTPELVMGMFSVRNNEQAVMISPQFIRSLHLYAPARAKKWNALAPRTSHAIRHFMATLMLNGLFSDRSKDMAHHLSTWCYPAEDITGDFAQAEFYPYWKNKTNPIRVSGDGQVLLSTSRGKNGKVLAVVVNQSPKKQRVEIDLGKYPAVKLTNFFFPQQKLQLKNGKIPLSMDPYDSLLIGIE